MQETFENSTSERIFMTYTSQIIWLVDDKLYRILINVLWFFKGNLDIYNCSIAANKFCL